MREIKSKDIYYKVIFFFGIVFYILSGGLFILALTVSPNTFISFTMVNSAITVSLIAVICVLIAIMLQEKKVKQNER